MYAGMANQYPLKVHSKDITTSLALMMIIDRLRVGHICKTITVIYLGSGFLSRKDCCNSLNKLYVTQV